MKSFIKKVCNMEEAGLNQLRNALKKAMEIDVKIIAAGIKAIGFHCKKCAECCMAQYGDNTVIVFPGEIKRICEVKKLLPHDFVDPMPSEDRDKEGNIHTFEWMLKKNPDCIFLRDKRCEIYELRPHLCRTYPFYLLDGKLEASVCRGLGGHINSVRCLELAGLLKERYILEIRESIALFEKFRGFQPGICGSVCVHDSEGEHWIKPDLRHYNYKHTIEYDML